MDLQLDGKRAIVTGGSKGIGLAIAHALAAEGAAVAIAARTEADLAIAAADLARHGRSIAAIKVDTADDASVRAMIDRAVESLGGVDILVNAAAKPASSGPVATLASLTDEAVRGELEVKLLGYLRCARAAAPLMIESGWGRIINISGLNARHASSIVGSVRNVAVAAMTKNLADELGRHGINVTVVHPGYTVTERTPDMLAAKASELGIDPLAYEQQLVSAVSIDRLVTAAEVAAVVAFLASPRSVAINGDAIAAGGGARGAIHY